MSVGKDLYGKTKGEMRLSERILAKIPGFKGYKEKEVRRETDKLIRNSIYRRLSEARNDLKEVFQSLSDQHLHEALIQMDRLTMEIDRVNEKVNHASYGYAGFFDALKINEAKLDKMITFDNGLIEYTDKLTQQARTFKKEVSDGHFENVMEQIKGLKESLDSLEDMFDTRKEAILEG